ncbi:BOS complex subunit NOMO3-like [Montipora foliosa]|uniref:BOS complex subunit NOMO3-like n=1 Tax=Montipora foliosa TaxID=591990 RepID=UPI0035F1A294
MQFSPGLMTELADSVLLRMILLSQIVLYFVIPSISNMFLVEGDDVVGCGGFVQSEVDINYSLVQMKLLSKQGVIKSQTECAPNNGYFLIPLYDKGTFTLKIDPPSGWSFDPASVELNIDGSTDKCSKGEDINFIFAGFTLSGKVISQGRELGPAGVEITIHRPPGDQERKTFTTEGGYFSFSRVMPGRYHVKASHASWSFENAETEVVVESSNANVMDKIIVSGYDVKGYVWSDGEPIQDVDFLLFSKTVNQKILPGCEEIPKNVIEAIKKKTEVDTPLCQVKSGVDGLFMFPSVPSGEYTLIPDYQGELITFDVVPSKLTFSVNYKSVVLKTPFQVHGFSVSGQVLTPEGQGIGDVIISAGEELSATTTAEGVYVLSNVTAGGYTLQANKENYFFNPVKAQVTPNTPRLPVITPVAYHLCGKLKIDEFPPGVTQLKGRKMILQTEGASIATRSMSTSVDGNGDFCFRVATGNHVIQPVITSPESTAGLALIPKEQVVTITSHPVLGIAFSQFRATVTGTVQCIDGSCPSVYVSLQSLTNPKLPKVNTKVTGSSFVFKDVFPGTYRASVLEDSWCWENETLEFKVSEADVSDLLFIQSGYILKCILSHNITLFFSRESGKENVDFFDLQKGTNKFCLKEPGVYNLMPQSCHQFDQNVFIYNTSAPTVLTLTAIKHLLSGAVKTVTKTDDIKVNIRSLKSNEMSSIGPLKLQDNNASAADVNNTEVKDSNKELIYNFSLWGRRGEEFEVTPVSSVLLFYPASRVVTVTDDCPASWVEFEGRQGVFLEGQVTPPLSGVEIVITSAGKQPTDEIKVQTDDQGKYRVGPLHGGIEYSLSASKAGFVITPLVDKKGHFQAQKLGQIEILVTDESNQPLSAVLLSLSAGQFRSNNFTSETGTMVFANLGPGQYFFRPMLKEYTFSPASQMINVSEGLTVPLQVKGKRVAFSCFGLISSLNGEPEKDVAVEAVGFGNCEAFQEETVSDQGGQYRLRGLQPGCMYRVRVKAGEGNPQLERASPSFIDIQVTEKDLQNINMIAFRHVNQIEITGNVVTDSQFISTLKVTLSPDNNPDTPLFTTPVGVSSYFQFPSVPNDGKVYVVRLVSSLSTLNYQYTRPESTVTASGVRAHVSFNFEPQPRKAEPEPTQGSLLTLPLILLLIFLAVNHNKVIPFLQQVPQIIQGVSADQLQAQLEDSFKNRKKIPAARRR